MEALQLLSRNEMRNIKGGNDQLPGGDCCLRCDQANNECDYNVSVCNIETMKDKCGDEFDRMKTVCVC